MVICESTEQRHTRMTRCATAPAKVTRMRARQSETPSEVSVNEVCWVADQERAHSARGSRRDVLEHAYDNLLNGIYRLPQSRPSTAFTCPVRPQRECSTARSVRSEPSSRSIFVRDSSASSHQGKSLLQLQCDDVLPARKPKCGGKIITEDDRRGKADKELSSIDISLEDFTCATRAKKYFPNLSLREVYDKIQNGEIAKCFIPSPKLESGAMTRSNKDDLLNSEGFKNVQNKHFKEASMFFLNIRDLNFKIASGKASRDWGFTLSKLKKRSFYNSSKSPFKTFVSPKLFCQDEPAYKTFYDPPLIPRVQQKPPPVFFAGHSLEYKLPERLPDEIVFVKSEKPKLTQRRTSRGVVKSPISSDEEPLDYEATLEDKLT